MGFSPDGRLLLGRYYYPSEIGAPSKTNVGLRFKFWNVNTNQSSRTIFTAADFPFADVTFSANGKILAAAGNDKVTLLATATGRSLGTFDCSEPFALNSDGRLLACKLGDDGLRIWNTTTRKKIEKYAAHANTIRVLAFSPN